MKLRAVGCSHHTTSIELREQVAFSGPQVHTALERVQAEFGEVEVVLVSTCTGNWTRNGLAISDVLGAPAPKQPMVPAPK